MSEAYKAAIEEAKRHVAITIYGMPFASIPDSEKAACVKVAEACLVSIIDHAIPDQYEWRGATHRALLSHLRERMTPPVKPDEPPKPPADAEQVERVAEAIWDNEIRWTSWAMADENTQDKYRREARAAIAAMGGGRRWGIWNDTHKCWYSGNFNSSDRDAVEMLLGAIQANGHIDSRGQSVVFEVREYVEQPVVKTAEEIADECLAPIDIKEKHRRITAAIENARKGADCGNH